MGELARCEAKIAATQHGGCEAVHDGLGLDVEISKHLVRPPAADEAQPITIDAGTQKRHGAAGPRRADGDVGGSESGVGVKVEGCADSRRDVGRNDVAKGGGGREAHRI